MDTESNCKICAWFRARGWYCESCDPDVIWFKSYDWEFAYLSDAELWEREPNPDLIEQASDLFKTDEGSALVIYRDLAGRGSVWAMEELGRFYRYGIGVEADVGQAYEWYRQAIVAGSWYATLRCAALFADQKHYAECEKMLKDGVNENLTPFFFWLAHYRLERSKSRATYREIEPLLERAAAEGHPIAQFLFARHMARGRFGIRKIWRGFRQFTSLALKNDLWEPVGDNAGSPVASQ